MPEGSATLPPLIVRLHDPAAYPHPVRAVTCIETHISWVLLTGVHAYKIKKPVAPGFLDFSTLPLRHAACLEELRLNRRLAPQIYLDVVPITGPPARARIGAAGAAIEYAVRMHEFAQADQLDRLLAAGRMGDAEAVAAASCIARFHDAAPRVDAASGFGTAAATRRTVEDVLRALPPLVADAGQRAEAEASTAWCRERIAALAPIIDARRAAGCVRECHGDLHLGNLVRLGDAVVPFDCIEFSAELRWIDVIADVAFLMMDLQYRGRDDLAFRLLNVYLETRGDYAGVAVLRYYLVYRALVRTLVALLRRRQLATPDAAAARDDAEAHLVLAGRLAAPVRPTLLLMHGLSGSGKTRVSDTLTTRWPAIRVRSDVERKRLLGVAANQPTLPAVGARAYSADTTRATYDRLAETAATALAAGYSAIVDAASLRRAERERFAALAGAHGADFRIVSCVAPETELRRRLRERGARGGDASEADESVLDLQLRHAEPLTASERAFAVEVDADLAGDADALIAQLSASVTPAVPA